MSWNDPSRDATTNRAGLVPPLPGDASRYLDGNGGWSTPSGIADEVINLKNYAIGDGVADDTLGINRAIAAAAGKVLFVPGGTYKTSGGHIITSPMTIEGAGRGTTGSPNGVSVFSLADTANTDLLTIEQKHVNVRDLGLYGNKANQSVSSRGLVLSPSVSASYCTFERLWVDSFLTENIEVSTPASSLSGTTFYRIESRNSGGHGVKTNAGANDLYFINCDVALNGLSGLLIGSGATLLKVHSWGNGILNTAQDNSGVSNPAGFSGGMKVIGGEFETNAVTGSGTGLFLRGRGNLIQGNQVYGNGGHGIYWFNSSVANGVIQGNSVYNNSQNGGGSGIVLDTLSGMSVTGNAIFDNQGPATQTYGILELNNPDYVAYFGNVSRAADHKTGNWSLGSGAHNLPLAASMATFNIG